MDGFIFQNTTKIIFGKNTISRIGKEISSNGVRKVLFVYGKGSIKRNGVYDKVVESLKKYQIEFVEHWGVKPNPVLSHVYEGIDKFKKENCDAVVACGGGSVIDEAKAIAAGVKYEGDVWDFFVGKSQIKQAAGIFTVLTLPATGSEANGGSVITNEKTNQKYSAHSKHLFPRVSILDPETTLSLPLEQTAYGCVDTMLHVLEGYFTTKDTDAIITDNYVMCVVKSVIESTRRIMKNPLDLSARASMMWSSTLALNGMEDCGYSSVEFVNHVIEHSLSAIYDIPHGLGLSIIFPAFLKKLHGEKKYSRIASFGRNVFDVDNQDLQQASYLTIERVEEFFRTELKLKTRLEENSIYQKDFPLIISNAMELGNLWRWSYKEKDIAEILNLAR